jgi:hypothetical protein
VEARALFFHRYNFSTDKWETYAGGGATSDLKMVVGADGNVGIGTTAPASQLHLGGTTNGLTVESNSVPLLLKESDQANGFVGKHWRMPLDGGLLRFDVSLTGDALFSTYRTALLLSPSGNVGIGTTSPNSELDIQSSSRPLRAARSIAAGGSTALALFERTNASGTPAANEVSAIQIAVPNAAGTSLVAGDVGAVLSDVTNGSEKGGLVFRTRTAGNVTEKLRIDDLGNVGIGTTLPGASFAVNGVIHGQASANAGDVLQVGNDTFLSDINVPNTVNLQGAQDRTVATLKLGTGGGSLSGYSGNVGIGTSAASGTLTVSGTNGNVTSGTPLLRLNDITTGQYLGIDNGNNANALRLINPTGPLELQSSSNANQISLATNGDVGGTNSPTDLLHVAGRIRSNDYVETINGITGNLNYTAGFQYRTNGYGYYLGMRADANYAFMSVYPSGTAGTAGTPITAMAWSSSGNVGIGTTSPSYPLEVTGGILNSASGSAKILSGSVSSFPGIWFGASSGAPTVTNYSYLYDTNSGKGPVFNAPSAGSMAFRINNADKLRMSALGGFAIGSTFADSNTPVEPGANNLIVQGNVGVGTTSPAYPLDVIYTSAPIFRVGRANFTGGSIYLGNNAHGIARDYNSITNDVGFYTTNADLHFSAGGVNTYQMTLKNNGNVGIGTTAPSYKLETSAGDWNGMHLLHPSTGASGGIRWTDGSSYASRRWLMLTNDTVNTSGTGNDGGIMFRTNEMATAGNVVPRMVISQSGNVGIGTTSPGSKFHISEAATNADQVIFGSNSAYGTTASVIPALNMQLALAGTYNKFYNGSASEAVKLWIGNYDNDGAVVYPIYVEDENNLVDFWIKNRPLGSAAPTMYFAGNVGVGTSAPSDLLHLSGATNGNARIRFTSIGGGGGRTWSVGTNGNASNADPNFGLTFRDETGGLDRMTISWSTGNVGIGTNLPSGKLDVNGGNLIISNDSAVSLGLVFKPTDLSASYPNSADERQFQWMTTGLTDGSLGYKFSWRNANGTSRLGAMSFNRNGQVYFDGGNVGIGTTVPDYSLLVNKESTGTAPFTGGNLATTERTFKISNEATATVGQTSNLVMSAGTSKLGSVIQNELTNTTGSGTSKLKFFVNSGGGFPDGDAADLTIQGNGNVGISSTAPAFKLDVAGSVRSTGSYLSDVGTGAAGILHYQLRSTSGVLRAGLGLTGVDSGSAAGSDVGIWMYSDDGSYRSMPFYIQRSSGNVGIGTAIPLGNLHVAGPANTSTLLISPMTMSLGDTAKIRFADPDSGTGPMDITYADNGLPSLNFIGGNVGIGTSSPAAKLESAYTAGRFVRLNDITESATFPTGSRSKFRGDDNNSGVNIIVLDNLDNTAALIHGNAFLSRLSFTSGSNAPVNAGRVLFQKENEWTAVTSTHNSNMQFATTGAGSMATRMTITSSGHVGIGTTSPNAKLEINAGTSDAGLNLVGDNTGNVAELNLIDGGSNKFWHLVRRGSDHATEADYLRMYYSPDNSSHFHGYLSFIPNNATDNSAGDSLFHGKLGIASPTPTATLHLGAGGSAASSAPLKFTSSAGALLSTREDGAMDYDGTNYYLTVGTTRYAIPLTGGSGSFTTIAASNGSATNPSHSFSGDPDTGFFSSGTDSIGFAANGTKIFDVSAAGIFSLTAGGAAITTANGTAGTPTYGFAGEAGIGWYRPSASNLAASVGGTERVRIDASGNVGIRTTCPIHTPRA